MRGELRVGRSLGGGHMESARMAGAGRCPDLEGFLGEGAGCSTSGARRAPYSGDENDLAAIIFFFLENFVAGYRFGEGQTVADDDLGMQRAGFDPSE